MRKLVFGCMVLASTLAGCSSETTLRRPLRLESTDGTWIGNAVCYGPHRDGQRPGGPAPSKSDLAEDLGLMDPQWKLLRTYGAAGYAEELLTEIRESGSPMKVMLGVWIAPDADEANQTEVDAAIRLASAFPDQVLAVSVGNETQVSWTAHPVDADVLIARVREVRAGVEVPVTVADDFNFWNKPESRAVAREIDFLTFHAHPMWNGRQLDEALPWLQETLASIGELHPDLPLVIGETGWATTVHDEGEQARLILGRAGEAEQSAYYEALRGWAASERQAVFFFEAFDENWKGGEHPDEVEKHWGLFRADRTPKTALAD